MFTSSPIFLFVFYAYVSFLISYFIVDFLPVLYDRSISSRNLLLIHFIVFIYLFSCISILQIFYIPASSGYALFIL